MRGTTSTPLALALAGALITTLAGCGGSDDNDSSAPPPAPPPSGPVTLQGSAMRNAALQNAVVCMDLNANSTCDSDEPASAPTDANGAWNLTYDSSQVSADQVAAASLIALVTPATTDAGRSGESATTEPYVLRQVPGKSGQINPLTTLVTKGMADGMTEASARSNAALQLGIAEAKIDNYQDDPAAGPEQVQDNARTLAAFTANALEAGAVLQVGDPAVGQDAEADLLNRLSYTDALNYSIRTRVAPARPAGSAERPLTEQRIQVSAGVPVTNVRALYPSIQLTAEGWKRCDGTTINTATLGIPNRSTSCGSEEFASFRTQTDIGGKTMAEVINTLQADPATNTINKGLTTAGLLAAVGTATFPANAQLRKTVNLRLASPLFVNNTSTDARPQAEATTLEQLITAKPATGVNLTTSTGSLTLGITTSMLRNLRVAFTGVTSPTDGTVQFYDCDLSAADVPSNCSATNTGTYHIDTVNGVRVMRFAGYAPTPASGFNFFYAEVKGTSTGDYIYRVRQIKTTLEIAITVNNRLDGTAWAALKAKLGL